MNQIAPALYHRILQPRRAGRGPHPAAILLHGRGTNEEDLLGLSGELDERLMFLSVRAPHPFSFGEGFTWYEFDAVGNPDPAMFTSSYDKLLKFIGDALRIYPIDPARLFLLGFSMGTVMSHAVALSRPDLVRGVMANSGYVPERTHLTYLWDRLEHLNIIITHGTLDPVIPIQLGRRAQELYGKSTARLTYKEYPMGHEISRESLDDTASWLEGQLNEAELAGRHG